MSHSPDDRCTNCGGFGHTRSECPWPRPGEEAARARLAPPCMGGWCRIREACSAYAMTGPEPAERLCEPGQDGVSDWPIRIRRAAGQWERDGARKLLAPAHPFDGLGAVL